MKPMSLYTEGAQGVEKLYRAGGCSQAVKAAYWTGSPWRAFALAFRAK